MLNTREVTKDTLLQTFANSKKAILDKKTGTVFQKHQEIRDGYLTVFQELSNEINNVNARDRETLKKLYDIAIKTNKDIQNFLHADESNDEEKQVALSIHRHNIKELRYNLLQLQTRGQPIITVQNLESTVVSENLGLKEDQTKGFQWGQKPSDKEHFTVDWARYLTVNGQSSEQESFDTAKIKTALQNALGLDSQDIADAIMQAYTQQPSQFIYASLLFCLPQETSGAIMAVNTIYMETDIDERHFFSRGSITCNQQKNVTLTYTQQMDILEYPNGSPDNKTVLYRTKPVTITCELLVPTQENGVKAAAFKLVSVQTNDPLIQAALNDRVFKTVSEFKEFVRKSEQSEIRDFAPTNQSTNDDALVTLALSASTKSTPAPTPVSTSTPKSTPVSTVPYKKIIAELAASFATAGAGIGFTIGFLLGSPIPVAGQLAAGGIVAAIGAGIGAAVGAIIGGVSVLYHQYKTRQQKKAATVETKESSETECTTSDDVPDTNPAQRAGKQVNQVLPPKSNISSTQTTPERKPPVSRRTVDAEAASRIRKKLAFQTTAETKPRSDDDELTKPTKVEPKKL